jgi:hypothetical protein
VTRARRLRELRQWQSIVDFLEAESERVQERLEEAQAKVWQRTLKGRRKSAYDKWFAKAHLKAALDQPLFYNPPKIPKDLGSAPRIKLFRHVPYNDAS